MPAERQPLRVIVDARGRVSGDARLFREAGPVLIATTQTSPAGWRSTMTEAGAQVLLCEPGEGGGVNLAQLLEILGRRGILSVWAEGGGRLLGGLLSGEHLNEIRAFLAPLLLGADGLPAVAAPGPDFVADAWRLREARVDVVAGDVLVTGYIGAWEPEPLA